MIEARAIGAGFFVDADRFIGNIRRPSVSGRLTERRFCAAPQVRRMPQGGFADRKLFN